MDIDSIKNKIFYEISDFDVCICAQIIAAALVSSCLAVPQVYEVPTGKLSFSSQVPLGGLYEQNYGGIRPEFKYGQVGVRPFYGSVQPAVKSVVSQSVHEYKTYGVQPVQDVKVFDGIHPVESVNVFGVQSVDAVKRFGAQSGEGHNRFGVQSVESLKPFGFRAVEGVHVYDVQPQTAVKPFVIQHVGGVKSVNMPSLQGVKVYDAQPVSEKLASSHAEPAVRFNVPPMAVEHSVPFVRPVTPFVNKYVAEARFSQPVVSTPKFSTYPVVQHTPYVTPYEKVVKPVAVASVVKPVVKFASPFTGVSQVAPHVPTDKYAHEVGPIVGPVPKYGQMAPVFYQQNVVSKSVESPAAILSQTHNVNVDGTFLSK